MGGKTKHTTVIQHDSPLKIVVEDLDQRWFKFYSGVIDSGLFRSLKPATKAVLVVLARFSDTEWVSFPSAQKIASLAGCSARHVWTCLNELEDANLLVRRSRGHRRSNEYRLLPVKVSSLPVNPSSENKEQTSRLVGTPVRTNSEAQFLPKKNNIRRSNTATPNSTNDQLRAMVDLLCAENLSENIAQQLASITTVDQIEGCRLLANKRSGLKNRPGFIRRCVQEQWSTEHYVAEETSQKASQTQQRDFFETQRAEDLALVQKIKAEREAQTSFLANFDSEEIEETVQSVLEGLPAKQARLVHGKTLSNSATLRGLVIEALKSTSL